jgi:hypothetical protein
MTPYISISDASTYFATKLNTSSWDNASNANRGKALSDASIRINRLNFAGDRNSEVQELAFPRNGLLVIPTAIQCACAELALALLDGVNPDIEVQNLRMASQQMASVRSTYDTSIQPENAVAGIPSHEAWIYLKPYLSDSRSVIVHRAS